MEASSELNITEEKKRPNFLTVICILSFVGCGLVFLTSIYSLIHNTPENIEKSIEQVRQIKPEMADQMEQNMLMMQESTYAKIAPYLSFVYLLLSFLGVLMMWKLNRKGFYIYIAGELLPYVPALFMGKEMMAMMGGGMNSGFMQTMITVAAVLVILFDLVFIGMYAANLKYMKK